MKKRNRNDVVLLKMQIFTDEQELIQLSDSHEIPLSFSVATFVVNDNTIQN